METRDERIHFDLVLFNLSIFQRTLIA